MGFTILVIPASLDFYAVISKNINMKINLQIIYQFGRKNWLYLSLSALIAVFIFLKIVAPPTPKYKITQVIPSPGSTKIKLNASITIAFEKPVKTEEVSFSSDPEFDYKADQLDRQTIEIIPQVFLHTNTVYTIEIKTPKNQPIFSWQFTTEELQSDPAVIQEATRWEEENHPLGPYTPYETEEFRINYMAPKTLQVTFKTEKTGSLKQKVLDWISSKGIKPESHTINWEIIE